MIINLRELSMFKNTNFIVFNILFILLVFSLSPLSYAQTQDVDNDTQRFYAVEVLSSEIIEDLTNSTQFQPLNTQVVKTIETVRLVDKPTLDDIINMNQEYLNSLRNTSGDAAVDALLLEWSETLSNVPEILSIVTISLGEGSDQIKFSPATFNFLDESQLEDPVNYIFHDNAPTSTVVDVVASLNAPNNWTFAVAEVPQQVYIDNSARGGVPGFVFSNTVQVHLGDFFNDRYHLRLFDSNDIGNEEFGTWSLGAVHYEEWNGAGHTIKPNGWEEGEDQLVLDLFGTENTGYTTRTLGHNSGYCCNDKMDTENNLIYNDGWLGKTEITNLPDDTLVYDFYSELGSAIIAFAPGSSTQTIPIASTDEEIIAMWIDTNAAKVKLFFDTVSTVLPSSESPVETQAVTTYSVINPENQGRFIVFPNGINVDNVRMVIQDASPTDFVKLSYISDETIVLNSAPIANPQILSATAGEPIDIVLTGSDDDGDSLTFSIELTPDNGSLIPNINILPNETPTSAMVTYTPNPAFIGTDAFTFKVRDDNGANSLVSVIIDVSLPDLDRPTAHPKSVSTIENIPIDIILTGFDPDGDPLTFSIIAGTPASGITSSVISLSDTSAKVTYTPNADFAGSDTLSFRVTNGVKTSPNADVDITVNPHINTAPIALGKTFDVPEDSLTFNLDVLSNVLDPDIATQGDTLSIASIDTSLTVGGTVNISGDSQSIIFTPDQDFDETTTFTFIAQDSELALSNSVTITIDMIPSPDLPTASPNSAIVGFNSDSNVIDVLFDDSDPDTLDTLTVVSVDNAGTRGIASIFDGGIAVTFTPEINFIGDTFFSYTLEDSTGNPATAQVDVTINAFDGQSIFVIDDGATKVNAYDSDTGEFLGNYIASGAGGLNIAYSIVVAPTNDFLLVSDPNANQIVRFDLATGTLSDFASPTVLTSSSIDPASSFPSVYAFDVKEDGNLLASFSSTETGDLDELVSDASVLTNYSILPASVAVYDGHTGRYIGEFVRPDLVPSSVAAIVNSVEVYDGSGNKEFYFNAALDGLSSPRDMIFDSDGSLLVANAGSGDVIRYDGVTGDQIEVFIDEEFQGAVAPLFLEFGPNDDYLYVASSASGGVLRYDDTTGVFFDKPILNGENGLGAIVDMSFGADGNLYVLDTSDDILQYDGTSAIFLSQFVTGSTDPNITDIGGMTWGPDGKLYLSNQISFNTNTLLKYDATGSFEEIFSTETEMGPMQSATRLLFASSPFGPPSVITDLTSTALSTSRIQLDWSAPVDDGGAFLVGYEIQRLDPSSSLFVTIVDAQTQGLSTTFTDSNISPLTSHTYRIITENLVDSSSPSNEASAITFDASQNVPPIAKNDNETIPIDTTVIINVLANDDDLDDELVILVPPPDDPENGVATIVTVDGIDQISYTPDLGFVGVDIFDYTISAGSDVVTGNYLCGS